MKRSLLALGIFTFLFSIATPLGLTQSIIPFGGIDNEIVFTCLTFALGAILTAGALMDHSDEPAPSKSIGFTAGATGFSNPMSDIEVQADRYELEQSIMKELEKIMRK
jgi:hypothetical protein